MEPVLVLGKDRFAGIDVRLRVSGGGKSSQVYAVRQALAKALVAYTQKCECLTLGAFRPRGGLPPPGVACSAVGRGVLSSFPRLKAPRPCGSASGLRRP